MAARAAWTCFIVLSLFALAGSFIFKLFGITLAAFEIAGGLILLLIGLEMLAGAPFHSGRRKRNRGGSALKRTSASRPWEFPCSPDPVPFQP